MACRGRQSCACPLPCCSGPGGRRGSCSTAPWGDVQVTVRRSRLPTCSRRWAMRSSSWYRLSSSGASARRVSTPRSARSVHRPQAKPDHALLIRPFDVRPHPWVGLRHKLDVAAELDEVPAGAFGFHAGLGDQHFRLSSDSVTTPPSSIAIRYEIRHGGVAPTRPGSGSLDLVGVVLAACSTVPLIAWRRVPLGVFVVTAAAGVLLAGLGYPVDLVPGPTVAVYLLAASRERQSPRERRTTATVVGLFAAYLAATAAAQGSFPAIQLLHTGMAWAVAWFAGERT